MNIISLATEITSGASCSKSGVFKVPAVDFTWIDDNEVDHNL